MPHAPTILIVDDNPTNLKLASDLLGGEGYSILRAMSAADAIRVLQSQHPDLILMDIQMPGMDGLELTRRLKADPATRTIPIIALTSFAMKGDEEKARDAGCDDYITKPIDTRILPSQVAAALARASSSAAPAP